VKKGLLTLLSGEDFFLGKNLKFQKQKSCSEKGSADLAIRRGCFTMFLCFQHKYLQQKKRRKKPHPPSPTNTTQRSLVLSAIFSQQKCNAAAIALLHTNRLNESNPNLS
jgi:hypothetical protein